MYSVLVKGLGSTTERIEVLWSCAPTGIGREGAIVAQILFMMTGAEHWTLKDGTQHPTGFWAEEFLGPHEVFCEAGHEVVVATPEGVVPTVDEASLTPDVVGGRENATAMARAVAENPALQAPIRVDEVVLADHVAVFLPGGHGPMEDLAVDPKAGGLLVSALEAGVPLGVVCHAPAALLTCLRDDGSSVFAGYRLTAFTNEEEKQVGLADKAPWLLQDRLVDLGVDFVEGEPWEPYVVRDRGLYSGQNPASSAPLAAEITRALG